MYFIAFYYPKFINLFSPRSINFKTSKSGSKIIAEEIIEEVKDETFLPTEPKKAKTDLTSMTNTIKFKSSTTKSVSLVKRKTPLVTLKSNPTATTTSATTKEITITLPLTKETTNVDASSSSSTTTKLCSQNLAEIKNGGLSLLSNYLSSSEESE